MNCFKIRSKYITFVGIDYVHVLTVVIKFLLKKMLINASFKLQYFVFYKNVLFRFQEICQLREELKREKGENIVSKKVIIKIFAKTTQI